MRQANAGLKFCSKLKMPTDTFPAVFYKANQLFKSNYFWESVFFKTSRSH